MSCDKGRGSLTEARNAKDVGGFVLAEPVRGAAVNYFAYCAQERWKLYGRSNPAGGVVQIMNNIRNDQRILVTPQWSPLHQMWKTIYDFLLIRDPEHGCERGEVTPFVSVFPARDYGFLFNFSYVFYSCYVDTTCIG